MTSRPQPLSPRTRSYDRRINEWFVRSAAPFFHGTKGDTATVIDVLALKPTPRKAARGVDTCTWVGR